MQAQECPLTTQRQVCENCQNNTPNWGALINVMKSKYFAFGLLRYATKFDVVLLIACITFISIGALLNWEITDSIAKFQTRLKQPPLDMGQLSWLAFKGVIFILAAYFSCAIGLFFLTTFCDRQIEAYKIDFLRVLLGRNILYFDNQQPGSLITMLESLDPAISQKLGMTLYVIVLVLTGQLASFIQSWRMALSANLLTVYVVTACITYKYGRQKLINRYDSLCIQLEIMIADVLAGVNTVILCNGQKFEVDRHDKLVDKQVRTRKHLKYTMVLLIACHLFFIDNMYIFVYYMSADCYYRSGKEVDYRMYYNYGKFILSSVLYFAQLTTYLPLLLDSIKALQNLAKVIDEDVHYKYPSRPEIDVLEGVNLEIKAGQKVAFVGSSGSGKSTAAAMLVKLLHPTRGRIFLDDARLDNVSTTHLRTIVGFVPQEPVLFTSTVKENLCLGFDVTEQELHDACQMAYALEFIERLPEGFDTVIGAGGTSLSGGQKQRLAIARALVRNPRILVLDEATSALDTESEAVVQTALDAASRGRTTITIAHRLSTIRNADNIFVFGDGKVIENGTHDDLVTANGSYAELVRAQRLGENTVEQHMNTIQAMSRLSITSNIIVLPQNLLASNKYSLRNLLFTKQMLIILAVGIGMTLVMLTLATPYGMVFTKFTEAIESNDWSDALFIMRLWFAVGVLINTCFAVITCISGAIICNYGLRVATRLRKQAYKNILNQDGYFFDQPQNTIGNLLSIVTQEPMNLDYTFDSSLLAFLNGLSLLLGPLIASVGKHPGYSLTVFAILFSIIVLFCLLFIWIMAQDAAVNKMFAEANTLAAETIQHVKTVQQTNSEKFLVNKYISILRSSTFTIIKRNIMSSFATALAFVFPSASQVITSFVGFLFLKIAPIQPIDIILLSDQLNLRVLFRIALLLPEISASRRAYIQLDHLANTKPVVDNKFETTEENPSKIEGNISLKSVIFAYPNRPEYAVLRGLTMKLPRGKTVAIVGASGCGKSTIVQLLARLYDPLDGEINIGGIPYSDINTKRLRAAFAFVGQDPALFDLPIWQNIAYGYPKASWDDIQDAARAANIHEFIRALPEGYETNLGSRGTQLSGGQRQRLAIARALVRDPSVIVFDEATSALDARSEAAFQVALANATRGKTCLIIAHRLSTVRDADMIVVMQRGKIIETGTHQDLINRNGVYRRLVVGQ
uniref:ABC-type xenobiotic transporter n=1 Tax=Panagrellus redivivus TaxID=6233 RepID=A0A7E4VNG9_PANRE